MKLKLKILNIFYLLISLGAIIAYVTSFSSFLSASFTYSIDSETLYAAEIDDSALDDFGITIDDLFSDLDTVVFEVKVNVSYTDLILGWTETTSNYNYVNSKFDAKGRYLTHRILQPALDNLDSLLQEDLTTIAENAVRKMLANIIIQNMNAYSTDKVSDPNCFDAMANNEKNLQGENLNDVQFSQTVQTIYGYLTAPMYNNSDRFLNGYEIEEHDISSYNPGLKDEIKPYFDAIYEVQNEDEAEDRDLAVDRTAYSVYGCLLSFGLYNEEDRFVSLDNAIGNLLSRLVDAEDYTDFGGSSSCVFVDKLFAPLTRNYVDEDNEFDTDNDLTVVLINVVAQSNANESRSEGASGPLFNVLVLLIQISGILLIVFLLCWIIKFIQCVISFFRAKPYIRMNPVGIVAGVVEALLAIISVVTLIVYNNNLTETMRSNFPILANIPLGLSFSLRFVFIPGILVIVNLLFSIVYGPVKKKFKQDSREELLYSNEYNDYE